MHICIDARLYGPLGKGLGRYVERLIENLEMIDTENRYSVLLSSENFDLYTPRNDRWKKYCIPVRWYTLKEQLVIPWMLWRLKPDLVHFPHFNVPLLWRGPFIVTIHDLILLKYPSTRASTLAGPLYWLKYLAYRLVLRHAIRNAKMVITVSNTVKKELEVRGQVSGVRCQVTYEACDVVEIGQLSAPGGSALGGKMPEAGVPRRNMVQAGWLAKRGITQPYFLYVGNAYPHKNLDFLLDWFLDWQQQNNYSISKVAAPQFPRSLPLNFQFPSFQLVLVGTEDYFYKKLKVKCQVSNVRCHSVIFFGYATEPELADLYRNAVALIYPSLDEGFGLPPLEAMRYDCPVLASDIPALREVLGNAAVFFDSRDPESLTRAVESILPISYLQSPISSLPACAEASAGRQSPRLRRSFGGQAISPPAPKLRRAGNLRSKKISLGRTQVQKYSWKRMAEQTLAIYRMAHENTNSRETTNS